MCRERDFQTKESAALVYQTNAALYFIASFRKSTMHAPVQVQSYEVYTISYIHKELAEKTGLLVSRNVLLDSL
jgi:hypothetical protein